MDYKAQLQRAAILASADTEHRDYWSGFIRGLRRRHHGDNFGTDDEHDTWMTASGDKSRDDRSRGYRDGFAGREPVPGH